MDRAHIPPIGSTVNPTTPWIMFRYAEILLNYAEASFMLGTTEGEETARQYLNMVRNRPGVEMPPVEATGEDLLGRIRHERRIELVFEGHRYFDVRRWKIADETESENIMGVTIEKSGNTQTYTPKQLVERSWDDKLYRLPIPQVEIDRSNGALGQNPGY
ncbi:RagB/SusD family nutrient uptake outer membrane protein [Anaerophaga thermohalophila]|uniref:RagB/SusD family nutrient uptake outer membrane protein n=1 Tax=Anaerophaga thermohalophila TaxID=177400 RepID=UPI0002D894E9|nr:RagB/SusD family nutrient uptake outer membrane protein [Anaerophaga thermohalophila]